MSSENKQGLVLFGMNNIYTVLAGENEYLCRIKGKILGCAKNEYTPLAAGDVVEFEIDAHGEEKGMILRRLPRTNAFSRFNKKRSQVQSIAVNLDQVVCVTSPDSPPFRPRFLDRLMINAGNIPVLIVLNKEDQGIPEWVAERLDLYEELGAETLICSAQTGSGLELVKQTIAGKRSAFIGQSGVGKSSLLNAIQPGLGLRVGEVSTKHNRGKHTTNFSLLIPLEDGTEIIDTPGIREIEIHDIPLHELDHHFPDLVPFIDECGFKPCSHTHEPRCAVEQALEDGLIHPDRFESYLRIYMELESRRKKY